MIKMVKLINGEEIIGKVEILSPRICISKPAMFGMVPGQNNQPQLGIADYLPFSNDESIYINESVVVCVYTPKTQIINAYNQSMGNGLIVPPAGIIK